jgi:hypothetical protein
MPTPLQHRSYELLIRTASAPIDVGGDWRVERVVRKLFDAASNLGTWMMKASAASSRESFRSALHEVHACVREVKMWVGVLDDLGRIDPEAASPLHEAAEEVHRLVIQSLRTSAVQQNGVRSSA